MILSEVFSPSKANLSRELVHLADFALIDYIGIDRPVLPRSHGELDIALVAGDERRRRNFDPFLASGLLVGYFYRVVVNHDVGETEGLVQR